MRRLLKYLLPLAAVAIFCAGADMSASADAVEAAPKVFYIDEAAVCADVSDSDFVPCLPRSVSFTNTLRVHNAPVRTCSAGRNNLEFVKAGRIFNAGVKYLIQKRSITVCSNQSDPSFMLLRLGKLII